MTTCPVHPNRPSRIESAYGFCSECSGVSRASRMTDEERWEMAKTLVRLLASQVEVTAPRGAEPPSVRAYDAHEDIELTVEEYELLREMCR